MSLLVEIITPEAKLYSDQASYVHICGSEGEFGVLPKHMNMISSLKTGIVRVTSEDEKELHSFVISDGFADVGQDKCIILVEKAINLATANIEQLKSKLSQLEETLENGQTNIIASKEIEFLRLAVK